MILHFKNLFLIVWSFLFLAGILSPVNVDAAEPGNPLWSKDYPVLPSGSDVGTGVVIDSTGNVYASGSTNLAPDSAAEGIRYNNDTNGTLAWSVSVDTHMGDPVRNPDVFYGVAVDSTDNNVFFVGNTFQQFGAGDDYPSVLLLNKYKDTGGDPVWSRKNPAVPANANNRSAGHAIAVDTADNIYVAGYHNDGTSTTNDDWIIAKYTSAGALTQTTPFNNSAVNGNEHAWGIAVDGQSVIVVGSMDRTGDEDPNLDWKIIKYDKNDLTTILWESSVVNQSIYFDIPYAVAVDSNNDIIVVGTEDNGPIEYADYEWVVRKFSGNTGNLEWTKTYTNGTNAQAFAVAIDDQDRIYVGGIDNDRWRLELRSNSDGTLLQEKTWTNLSNAGIRGLSFRSVNGADMLAITGYADGATNRDWHTELWNVSSISWYKFPWATFMPAITGMKP